MLWSLAQRNVRRNPRRTALTLVAVILGVTSVVFVDGFINGFLNMITGVVREGRLGSLQVHARGYMAAETDRLKFSLPLSDEMLGRMRAIPGVSAVAPRILFEALVNNGSQASLAIVTALDPVPERAVCPSRWNAVEGRVFTPAQPSDSLMGRTLLDGLGGAAGDNFTLTAAGPSGAQNALDLHVQKSLGFTDPLQSKRMLEVTLPFAQDLLGMEGRVTEYAVALDDGVELEPVAARLREVLGPSVEVHTWLELTPELSDNLATISAIMVFVTVFLFLLVLSGIANTTLMSVHERTREIGTMLAMGMRRAAVVRMFLAEAGVLGLVGGSVGGLLGWLLVKAMHHVGVPLPMPGGDIDNYLRPYTTVLFCVGSALGCAVGGMVAALYPARRAARLRPVEALRND